ncbi:MAG: PD40 domain-containing protein [Chloroflexia bacterium]|nr:PD40 domain-containing protein [Chloroflexia bacterium]
MRGRQSATILLLCSLLLLQGCQPPQESGRAANPTPTDPHQHVVDVVPATPLPEIAAGFAFVRVTLDPQAERYQITPNRAGTRRAFCIQEQAPSGGWVERLIVEDLAQGSLYEIQGLPLPWRPFSDLAWLDEDVLVFDRWAQPHYGTHYAVDVRQGTLLLASPFSDQGARPQPMPPTSCLTPPEENPTPDWTCITSTVPEITPATTLTPTSLSLSWTGPLLVPAILPDPSDDTGIVVPIFDAGSGQSVLFPLKGFRAGTSIEGWSADGCSLFFDASYSGESEYLVNIVTGVRRRLLGDTWQRLFSPDGEWVASTSRDYQKPGQEGQWMEISVARADGNEPASLITEGWCWLIGWTDDSSKVLYKTQEEGIPGQGVWSLYAVDVNSLEQCLIARVPEPLEHWEDLYLANVASCERIPLALSGSLESARWVMISGSPGYHYIALFLGEQQRGGDGHAIETSSFLVVDMETGQENIVLEEKFWISDHWAWSPDGTRLVLVGDLLEGDGVYVVETATGQRRKLPIGLAFSPSWSPDGRFLALQSLAHGSFLYDLQAETILPLPAEFGPFTHPQQQRLLWSPRISYGSGACR